LTCAARQRAARFCQAQSGARISCFDPIVPGGAALCAEAFSVCPNERWPVQGTKSRRRCRRGGILGSWFQ